MRMVRAVARSLVPSPAVLLALASALVTTTASASSRWTSFGSLSNCLSPVSIDGRLAAFADEMTGQLSYYDIPHRTKYDTGLLGATPSIKGTTIAYQGYGADSGNIYLYDIPTGTVTFTGVSTAKRRMAGTGWGAPGRYFSGQNIAFIDAADNHLKYYSLATGSVTDTGNTAIGDTLGDPTTDGNIIAFGTMSLVDASSTYEYNVSVYSYDIVAGTTTLVERWSGTGDWSSTRPPKAVVSGNVIAYETLDCDVKYRLIDSGETFSTGINTGRHGGALSTDGLRIVASRGFGMPLAIFDLSTGEIVDTGLYVCDGDPCWVEISGGTIASELYEGGTRDAAGNPIYPPTDLNGDGYIVDCVAVYAKI